MSILPLPQVMGYPLDANGDPNNDALLATIARNALPHQRWLEVLVTADAAIVLSGSGEWCAVSRSVDCFHSTIMHSATVSHLPTVSLTLTRAHVSVLTSYVGVIGLLRRMALDRCVPAFFATRNRFGSLHYSILIFATSTSALYLLVAGNTIILAGVYALSFLAVMFLFAVSV